MSWFSSIYSWFTSGGRKTFNESQERELQRMMNEVLSGSSYQQRENEAKLARRINELVEENARKQDRNTRSIQGQLQEQLEAFEKIKRAHQTDLDEMTRMLDEKISRQGQAFENLHQMHEMKIDKVTKDIEKLRNIMNEELELKEKKSKTKKKNEDDTKKNTNKHAQELIQLLNDLKNTIQDKDKELKPTEADHRYNPPDNNPSVMGNTNFMQHPNNNFQPNSRFPQGYRFPPVTSIPQGYNFPHNANFPPPHGFPPHANNFNPSYSNVPPNQYLQNPGIIYPVQVPQTGNFGQNNFRPPVSDPRNPCQNTARGDTCRRVGRGGKYAGYNAHEPKQYDYARKKEFSKGEVKKEHSGPKKKEFPMGDVKKGQRQKNEKNDNNESDIGVSDAESVSSVISPVSDTKEETVQEFFKHIITGLNKLDSELNSINLFLNEPSCRCMYQQWGEYLLDILIAGSPYKTRLSLTPEDLLTGVGNLSYEKCLFNQPDTLHWPKHFKEVTKKLMKNYKYLNKKFQSSLELIFQKIHIFNVEKRKKLAQFTGLLLSEQLFGSSVLFSLIEDRDALSNGSVKTFFMECLVVWKYQSGVVKMKKEMRNTKFVPRWLEFFPEKNSQLQDLEIELRKKGLIELLEFYNEENKKFKINELINILKSELKRKSNTDQIKSKLKEFAISNTISEEQAVKAIWTYLIGLSKTMKDEHASILSAFTTNTQSERILMEELVHYCDKQSQDSFAPLISQFHKAQSLSPELITDWYRDAYYKGQHDTLVQNIKKFVEWLESPDDGNTSFNCESNNANNNVNIECNEKKNDIPIDNLDELDYPKLEDALNKNVDIHTALKIKLLAMGKDKNTGESKTCFPETMNDVFDFRDKHNDARLFKLGN